MDKNFENSRDIEADNSSDIRNGSDDVTGTNCDNNLAQNAGVDLNTDANKPGGYSYGYEGFYPEDEPNTVSNPYPAESATDLNEDYTNKGMRNSLDGSEDE